MIYNQKKMPRAVFRAYDIRGVIGRDLDEDSFYTLGFALACFLHKLKRSDIYLARDGRLTSKSLALALKAGLLESGINIVDLGQVATPVMYYATHALQFDCGLMVTGSHNPADYNGLKMVLAGKTLTQEDIDVLYESVTLQQRIWGLGTESTLNVMNSYTQRVMQGIQIKRPLKVVVDAGNGIAGPTATKIFSELGCEVIPLYCEVDGHFPNHHPDPSVEANLDALKAAVFSHQADLGLAFDGDADRLGLITNKAEMVWPDRLMMLFAREVLSRRSGATIVYDVKCSAHLGKVIQEAGGVATMCPTGHSIVKSVMKRENAVLAGEMSGHLFFKDRWFGFDDAIYSACRLLELISASPLTVSEQFELIPNSINTPELKINIADENKFVFMEQFITKASFPAARIVAIDGVRVEFDKGWGLLRASNTTPCLVARFEAVDIESLAQIQLEFKKQIQLLNAEMALPF